MRRRTLFRGLGAAALSLACPASAQPPVPFTMGQPLLLTICARGGWDPTLFCDPSSASNAGPGPLYWSLGGGPQSREFDQFRTRYGHRIRVINGIDTATLSHTSGRRAMWTGKRTPGYPHIQALLAHQRAAAFGLAVDSGFSETAGLIHTTRLQSPSATASLLQPDHYGGTQILSPAARDALGVSREDRIARLQQQQASPETNARLAWLRSRRQLWTMTALGQAVDADTDAPAVPTRISRAGQVARTALYAMSTGLAAGAHVGLSGFDTHNPDTPNEHASKLVDLLWLLDDIIQTSIRLGLDHRLVIVVGSDFGRGPTAAGGGSDHHPVTSAIAMGPGIVGNTTVGSRADGVLRTAEGFQRSLRQLMGIGHGAFPLDADALTDPFA